MFHTKSELQNKTELYQATCGNKQSFCMHCIDWTQIMLCIMDGTWVMSFYRCAFFYSNYQNYFSIKVKKNLCPLAFGEEILHECMSAEHKTVENTHTLH